MIIDTHCHLYMDAFDPDREAVIARAREFGVKYIINVGIDEASNTASHALAQQYPFIFHAAGFHPHSAGEFSEEFYNNAVKFVSDTKPVAIGEIGLDYFKSQSSAEDQKKSFGRMIHLALDADLPVIVHSRDAFKDTFDIIKSEGRGKLRGVMHCFSYDLEAAKAMIDLGFLISFTCNLTFKNAGNLLEVAKSVPLESMMLETDAPYLAPQIYRGKRNEPCCLVNLVDFLSGQRAIAPDVLESETSKNAIALFGLNVANE